MKNIRIFLSENFHFLVVDFSKYFNRRVSVMRGFQFEEHNYYLGLHCALSIKEGKRKNTAIYQCIFGGFHNRLNKPQRQETYLRTCAPSKDSDQPAHSGILIRTFTWRISDSQ